MSNPTKEDVQEALYFLADAKAEIEKEIREFVNSKIGEFCNKTGTPITSVYIDIVDSTDLKGDAMSYVSAVNCSRRYSGDF